MPSGVIVGDKTATAGAWNRSLGVRLLTLVCLALLPVSALSIWQGVERIRLDQQNIRQILRQGAFSIATDERNAFVAAEQLLLTLANESDIRFGRNACQRRLQDSLRGLASFGNLARLSADGTILCAAVLPPSTIDVTALPWWKEALVRRDFFVSGPLHSEALRHAVFAGVLPLATTDGAFDGTLNVAINLEWLVNELGLPRGSIVALLDKAGGIVASNAPKIAPTVFARSSPFPKGTDAIIPATGPGGQPWSLTVAPAFHSDHSFGFAMPDSELTRLSYMSVAIDLLLPVLMILIASLAIWLATHRLVVQWIDTLARMAVAYGKGHYAIRPQSFDKAPREFQVLGTALSDMAGAVQERDRSLKDALAQKDTLVKEIHHRVKNTLQIVVSLLNLQSNHLRDTDARAAMDQARARINALALTYGAIYELDLGGAVDLKPLLSEAVKQAQHAADEAHANLTVTVTAVSCTVSGDTAIPLMLFVNEAMTNAYRHMPPEPDVAGQISVSLQPAGDGRVTLVIADNGAGLDAQLDTGMSIRLMHALVQQISGEMTTRTRDGGGTVVELSFAAQPDRTGPAN